MKSDPSDDSRPDVAEHDIDESEVARLVSRYIDDDDEAHIRELRERLNEMIQGEIVSLSPEGTEVIVVVERDSSGEGSSRHTYTVRSVTDFEGDPALDWAYIGAQN